MPVTRKAASSKLDGQGQTDITQSDDTDSRISGADPV